MEAEFAVDKYLIEQDDEALDNYIPTGWVGLQHGRTKPRIEKVATPQQKQQGE